MSPIAAMLLWAARACGADDTGVSEQADAARAPTLSIVTTIPLASSRSVCIGVSHPFAASRFGVAARRSRYASRADVPPARLLRRPTPIGFLRGVLHPRWVHSAAMNPPSGWEAYPRAMATETSAPASAGRLTSRDARVDVWRQADRFADERGSVQTWILTIARSRALDRLRATRRLREDPIDADNVDELARSAANSGDTCPRDPSLDVEHGERRRLVLAALGALPVEQREALELGYFGGLSQSEIAERTGQPLGTIKTRTRLAMQKLRERLAVLSEDTR